MLKHGKKEKVAQDAQLSVSPEAQLSVSPMLLPHLDAFLFNL